MLRALVATSAVWGAAAFSPAVAPAAAPTLRTMSLMAAVPASRQMQRKFSSSAQALGAKGRDSSVDSGDIGGYFTGGGGFNEIDEDDDEDVPLAVKMDALRRMQEFKALNEGQMMLQSGQMRATGTALEVTVEELRDILQESKGKTAEEGAPFLLDCREADEFAYTKVEGFELIPMSELATRVEDVPKDRPVFVMCHHGMRSMQVTRYLRTKGLRAVSNIEGGIEAWSTRIDPSVARY